MILAGAGVYGYGHLTGGGGVTANGWAAYATGSDTGTQCTRFATARTFASLDPAQVCKTADWLAQVLAAGDTGCVEGNVPAGDSMATNFDTGGVFFTFDASKVGAVQTTIDFNCGETSAPSTPNIGARTFLTSNFSIGVAGNQTSTTIPVTSTAGFDNNGGGQFKIYVGTGGTEICTGMTSTSFTGCTLTGSSATKSFLANLTDVSQGSLVINAAQSLTIKNAYPGNYISTQGVGVNDADGIIIDHAHSHHGWRHGGGSHNITVQNSECGPNDMGGQEACDITSTDATNIVWNNDTFHDMSDSGCSTVDGTRANFCHAECVYLKASGSITISNSRFWNCATFSIFAEDFIGTLQNIVLQNNTFEDCLVAFCPGSGSLALTLKSDSGTVIGPVTVEYNSFSNGQRLQGAGSPAGTFTGIVFRANSGVGATYDNGGGQLGWCNLPGIATLYNVTTSAACSATDTNIAADSDVFTDVSGHPYDFTPIGVALGHGDPNSFPTTDINGTSRLASTVDAGAVQVTAGSGGISGASQATCSPSACGNGTTPSFTVQKVPITVSDGVSTDTYHYSWYKPTNLVGSPAAVFVAGGAGCGSTEVGTTFTSSGWQSVANANALMLIILGKPTPCVTGSHGTSGNSWAHEQIDCGGALGVPGAGSCGTASSVPTDAPFLVAVRNSVCSSTFGGTTVDCNRLYLNGASAGGALTRMAACDPTTVGLFRGYSVTSNGANALYTGTTGVCPGGSSNYFMQQIMGTNDLSQGPYNTLNVGTPIDHTILGFDATRAWWQTYQGCSSPTTSTVGVKTIYDYDCPFGSNPGFQAIKVTGGGHTWVNLDTVLGASGTANLIWDFFESTVG